MNLIEEIKAKALSVYDITEFLNKLDQTEMSDEKYEAELNAKSYVPIEWLGLLKPVLAHLQKLEEILEQFIMAEEGETGDYPDTYNLLQETVEWKEELDKLMKGDVEPMVCIKRKHLRSHSFRCATCGDSIEKVLGDAPKPRKELKK